MTKTRVYTGLLNQDNNVRVVNDSLALEHPLSVLINGEPFTLTMQTPGNELELIRGLLFSEGVYKKKDGELNYQILEKSPENFISKVNLIIPIEELDQSLVNKRNLLSVASCGICGKTELNLPIGEVKSDDLNIELIKFKEMFELMRSGQAAFEISGGSHAAAIFNHDFQLMTIMEDIGRHNAVDKCIGALLNEGKLSRAKYLLVSGRVSYEIITKCFAAGIPVLAAVSAPSTLAVDFAKELGIKLFGFCRENRATQYA
jgi:FdhD protein